MSTNVMKPGDVEAMLNARLLEIRRQRLERSSQRRRGRGGTPSLVRTGRLSGLAASAALLLTLLVGGIVSGNPGLDHESLTCDSTAPPAGVPAGSDCIELLNKGQLPSAFDEVGELWVSRSGDTLTMVIIIDGNPLITESKICLDDDPDPINNLVDANPLTPANFCEGGDWVGEAVEDDADLATNLKPAGDPSPEDDDGIGDPDGDTDGKFETAIQNLDVDSSTATTRRIDLFVDGYTEFLIHFNADVGGEDTSIVAYFQAEEQGTKSGVKFESLDGAGPYDDSEDTLVAGWTIYLYEDTNGNTTVDAGEASPIDSTTTAASTGLYTFSLDPGDYIVCEAAASGWSQSFPTASEVDDEADCALAVSDDADPSVDDIENVGYAFTITSGSTHEDNDFGNFELITKSGFKFNDNDMDGAFEPAPDPQTDTKLAGWTVELWKLSGLTWEFVAADSITVAADGYSFSGLGPGTFAVCEISQPSWQQSFPFSGATLPAGESLFDCTTLTPNSGGTFAPFGFQFTASSGTDQTNNIFGNFLVPPGCSLTQGYWKTHSELGPAPYDSEGWGALGDIDADGIAEEEGEDFFDSGLTWYEVFWTNPKGGNAWYILAHQYMAAVLNQANGAGNPAGLTQALADAAELLDHYDGARSIPKSGSAVLTSAKDRTEAIAIAGFLAAYNEGTLPGTSHCGELNFAGFTTLTGQASGAVLLPPLAPIRRQRTN